MKANIFNTNLNGRGTCNCSPLHFLSLCLSVIAPFILAGNFAFAQAQSSSSPLKGDGVVSDDIKEMLHNYNQKIYFTENKGQWPANVLYKADFHLGQAIATKDGMLVGTFDPADVDARYNWSIKEEEAIRSGAKFDQPEPAEKGHGWLMNFVNHSADMTIETEDKHTDVFNYFTASGSTTGANNYQEVWYKNVYNNVDVRYYPSPTGTLEYDVVCKPGFNKNEIAIQLTGISKIRVAKNGHLVLTTSVGDMDFPAPVAYQKGFDKKQIPVKVKYYVTDNNVLHFTLGNFDASKTLIIDPIALRWATWMTNNSAAADHGHCIWIDPTDGGIYVVSRFAGAGLITVDAFQANYAGGSSYDFCIGKYYEPTSVGGAGTRVWQTYLGGTGEDNPYSITQGLDSAIYITGYTGSTNFPMIGGTKFGTLANGINESSQVSSNNFGIVITKIWKDGQSIKSAVVAGNGQNYAYDMGLDSYGDITICGFTSSTNLKTLFPATSASNTNNGDADVLVFQITSNFESINWMTNYGGKGRDIGTILQQNPVTNEIYIAGSTASTNFPVSSNARQKTLGGTEDGFIQKLDPTGNVVWSSYFNSAKNDSTVTLCMNFNTTDDALFFGGLTTGLGTNNTPSGTFQSAIAGGQDFFCAVMDTNQTFVASTYIGGSGNEVNMMGLNVDLNNDVYIFGYTPSTNFPVSTDALQSTNYGDDDKVFFKLNTGLTTLMYGTYYGGTDDDYDPVGERGIKFSNCRIYTIVTAESPNIPLTQGAITTHKLSSTSIYEPGIVEWSNPPDLLGNTLSGNQSLCAGQTPSNITGSVPSYSLPNIVRYANTGSSSDSTDVAYPVNYNASVTYQWQESTDSINWTSISGATTQNLTGSLVGALYQTTYIRRIIGGDACVVAGASASIITVKVLSVTADVNNGCYNQNNGSITVTSSSGTAPYTYSWSGGSTGATLSGLAPGTYHVTVTDHAGCSATGSFTTSNPTQLTAQASSTTTTNCQPNASATVSPSGGTSPYTYSWSNGGNEPTIYNLGPNTYTATVTDADGCTVTASTTISGSAIPNVQVNSPNICSGASASLVASGASTYTWSPTTDLSPTTGASVTASPTATLTYTVTGTGSDGCTATAVSIVTVNPNPSISAGTAATICAGTPTGLTASCSANCTGISYSWSPVASLNQSTGAGVTASPTTTTTYTIIGTNSNSCTASATVKLTVTALPTVGVTVTSGNQSYCTSGSAGLTATGATTYTWAPTTALTKTTGATTTATPTVTTTYTVTGTTGSCSNTASVVITVYTPVQVDVSSPSTCPNVAVNITGSNVSSYKWAPATGLSATTGATVSVTDPTSTTSYTVTGTDANGCTTTATSKVTVYTPTQVDVTSPSTCPGVAVNITGSNVSSYTWAPATGLSATTGATVSVTDPTSTTSYTVTGTDANGCTTTATSKVTVYTPAQVAVNSPSTCPTIAVNLNASNDVSYTWAPAAGLSATTGATVSVTDPTSSTAYTVTGTDANGCKTTAVSTVTVYTPAQVAVNSPSTCPTIAVNLNASNDVSYTWAPAAGLSATTGATVSVTDPTSSTAYTVTGTDANGCKTTAVSTVTVYTPEQVAVNSPSTCPTIAVNLNASNDVSYTWAPATGLSATTGATVSVTDPTSTTSYTVTGTDANGCKTTAVSTVTVYTPEQVAVNSPSTCPTIAVNLNASNDVSYTWAPAAGLSATTGATVSVTDPTSSTAYTVTGTDANGCKTTAVSTVTVYTPAQVAVNSPSTCPTIAVNLNASNDVSYSWSPSAGLNATTGATVSVTDPTSSTAYTVTGTDANGCKTTAVSTVTVYTPAQVAVNSPSTCPTIAVNLNASNDVSYTWAPAAGLSATTGATVSVTDPTSSTAYTVTGTDANGCKTTAVSTVTVYTPEQVAVNSPSTCPTIAVNLNASNDVSYTWAPAAGLSATTGATVSVTDPTSSTAYTVTGTDANGCKTTAVSTVTVYTPAQVAVNSPSTCPTIAVNLNASNDVSYSWSPSAGLNATTGATVSVTDPTSSTAYTVTGTDANGCKTTAVSTVTVYTPAQVAVNSPSTCPTIAVNLNASNDVSYTWAPAAGLSATTGATVSVTDPTSSTAYTVTGTDANGCKTTAVSTVTVYTPEQVAVNSPSTCPTIAVNLNASNDVSYTWAPATGLSATTGATVSVTDPTSTTSYTVTGTDANGCKTTAVSTVTVYTPEQVAVNSPSTCPTIAVNLNASNDVSYTWAPAAGLSATTGATVSVTDPSSSTAYTVTGTDANGCKTTAVSTVTIYTPVQVDVTSPSTCKFVPVNITASNVSTYTWTPSTGLSVTTGATVSVTDPTSITSYTVTGTDANGCTTTAVSTVTVNPLPAANAGSNEIICLGGSSSIGGSNVSGDTYSWIPTLGLNNSTISNPTANPTTTTTYTLTETITATGCSASNNVVVMVNDTPTVTIQGPNTVCSYQTANLTTNASAGSGTIISYQWYEGGGLITGATNSGYTATSSGTYTVVLGNSNSCGGASAPFVLTITSPISIQSSIIEAACSSSKTGSIKLTVSGGTPSYSYSWNNGGGNTDSIGGLEAGFYYVTVYDANLCTATQSFQVTEPKVLALTPNITDATCYGFTNGSIYISPSGGTEPYTYTWSDDSITQSISNLGLGKYSVTVTDANGCTAVSTDSVTQPPAISIVAVVQNATCNGAANGSISINTTGGTPLHLGSIGSGNGIITYIFDWSDGTHNQNDSGLTAGTYMVTVIDSHGCSASDTFTVSQPDTLKLTAQVTAASCYGSNDGSINISLEGGTPSYTYSWSNSSTSQNISGLTSGEYTVTVTDQNGCVFSQSFDVSQPAALTISGAILNATCHGSNNGLINITVGGGTTPYTYSWSDGDTRKNIDGLGIGQYIVTVTDSNKCTIMDTFTIGQPDTLAINPNTITEPSCYGFSNGAISISVGGGTIPYTYSWSNGNTTQNISGLATGNYTVTLTDSNKCSISRLFILSQPDTLVIATATVTNVTCYGFDNGAIDITVNGGTSPYTYSWSNGNTTANNNVIGFGSYSVLVTDANGCTATGSYYVSQPPALAIVDTVTDVTSCSITTTGGINIGVSGGVPPYTYAWSPQGGSVISTSLDLTDAAPGIYCVTVTDANTCTTTLCDTIKILSSTPPSTPAPTFTYDSPCDPASTVTVGLAASGITGGVPPYSISWSNGATTDTISGVAAGTTYYVTVTDSKGCTTSSLVGVPPNTPLSILNAYQPLYCAGTGSDSIAVQMNGGTTPFNIVVVSEFSGDTIANISGITLDNVTIPIPVVGADIDDITATDAIGCSSTFYGVFVISPAPLAAILYNIDSTSCSTPNGQFEYYIYGGTPFTGGFFGYYHINIQGPGINIDAASADSIIGGLGAGTYTITASDSIGCLLDTSITIYDYNATYDTVTTSICQRQSYTVGGQSFSTTGSFNVTLTNSVGCDSIVTLNLKVLDTSATTLTPSICQGTSYTVGGQSFNATGTYTIVLANAAGCDSVVTLNLTVLDTSAITLNQNICQRQSYTVGTQSFNATGTYTIVLTNAAGCDSVVTLNLTVLDTSATTLNPTICQRQSYTVGTQNFNTTGTYTILLTNAAGCDSVVTLNLTVLDTSATTLNPTICQRQSYTVGTQSFNTTGTYTILLTNAAGCDSVVTLNLTVLDTSATTLNPTICQRQSYTVGTQSFNTTGTYTILLTNAAGCDSVVTLNLTVLDTIATTLNPTICQRQSYTVGTQSFNTTGTYVIPLKNIAGCDSIVTLHLTVLDTSATSLNPTICQRQSYTVGNSTFNQTGTYTIHLTNAAGCDSIVTLNLTVLDTSATTLNPTICAGTSYTVGNSSYSETGIYTIRLTNAAGCDSVVTLNLTVDKLTLGTSDITDVTCYGYSNGAASVNVSNGAVPYTYSWSTGSTNSGISDLAAGEDTVTVTDQNSCSAIQIDTITQPTKITITVLKTVNVACYYGNQGSAQYTFGGGTPPYSVTVAGPFGFYQELSNQGIDDTINTGPYLPSFYFLISVTDANGCNDTLGFKIYEPDTLVGTTNFTNITCYGQNNGTASVTPTGGTTPYTYSWSYQGSAYSATDSSISNLQPGNYCVTVTDNHGCSFVECYGISQPPALAIVDTVTDVTSCSITTTGGINIGVSGGVPPYTYAWSPQGGSVISASLDLTDAAPGIYCVTVTDANTCTTTLCDTIKILSSTPPSTPAPTFTYDSPCDPASTVTVGLAASGITGGVPPYSISWSNGATTDTISGVAAGTTYYVTVTDSKGCTTSSLVGVPPNTPLSILNAYQPLYCAGTGSDSVAVQMNGGTTPFNIVVVSEFSGDTIANISGITLDNVTIPIPVVGADIDDITATDAIGCSSTFYGVFVISPAPLAAILYNIDSTSCSTPNGQFEYYIYGGTPFTGGFFGYYHINIQGPGINIDAASADSIIGGLGAGTYTITASDSIGCLLDTSITIYDYNATYDTVTTSICQRQSYTVGGQSFNTTGSFNVTLTNSVGCDSIVTLNLTVLDTSATTLTPSICQGTSYTVGGQSFNATGTYTIVLANAAGCDSVVTLNLTVLDTSATTLNPTICAGNSYTVGTSSFSQAGTYTVVLSNAAGCDSVVTLNLTVDQISAIINANASCQQLDNCQGSINAIVTGGSGTLSYTWSGIGLTSSDNDTIKGLCSPELYKVTVTDGNGCSATAFKSVICNSCPAGTATLNGVDSICASALPATISVNTTSTPLSYSWSTLATTSSINVSTSGIYTVTVVFGDCQTTLSDTVTVKPQPQVSPSHTDVACYGACNGTITLTVSGVSSHTTAWIGANNYTNSGDDLNDLCAGTYYYTVTADGCITTGSVTINQATSSLAATPVPVSTKCYGSADGSLSLTISGGTTPYTIAWAFTAATNDTIYNLTYGSYCYTVYDANKCSVTGCSTVGQPDSLSVTVDKQDLTCSVPDTSSCNGFTTYTQGGYGTACHGQNPGCFRDANFPTAFPGGLTIGCTNKLELTTSAAVEAFLPSGTAPAYLPSGTLVNPTSYRNVFAGQVVTLALNVGFFPNLAPLIYTGSGPFNGWTVQQILDTCNAVIGGCPSLYSPSDLNDVADNINGNYDGGTTNDGYLKCSNSGNTNTGGACNGSITINVSGGTGTKNITWANNGVSGFNPQNLCAGKYCYTITDANSCSESSCVTINAPAAIVSNIGGTNPTDCVPGQCNGSVSVSPSGGTPAYTLTWSTGGSGTSVSGLCAGTYKVTITDATGCSTIDSVKLLTTSCTCPVVTTSHTNSTCYKSCNGTATLHIANASLLSYSIAWTGVISGDTSLSNLCAGQYCYTVTFPDINCSQNGCITIGQPDSIGTTLNQTICQRQSYTVGTQSFNTTGTYVIPLKNIAGCDSIVTLNLTVIDTSATTLNPTICAGTSYTVGSSSFNQTGTYTVVLTNAAGCDSVVTLNLSVDNISVSVTDNASCQLLDNCQAFVAANVTGGSAVFSYKWSGPPGFTGTDNDTIKKLCNPGIYKVIVTDGNGCTATGNAGVSCNECPADRVTISGPKSTCTTSFPVTLKANSTEPAISYNWSGPGGASSTADSINVTQGGIYSLTVVYSDCQATIFDTLTINPQPLVTATPVNSKCKGACNGSITLDVTNVNSYTTSWTGPNGFHSSNLTEISNLCPGNYCYTVSANGCTADNCIEITEPSVALSAPGSATGITCGSAKGVCNGTAIVTPSGGTSPYTIVWEDNPTSSLSRTGLCAGTYYYTVTDKNGCNTDGSVVVNPASDIVINVNATGVTCHPMCGGTCNGSASVTASGGVSPYTITWTGNYHGFDLSDLCAGTYHFTVTDKNGCSASDSAVISMPAQVIANVTKTDVTCHPSCGGTCNGSANVNVTGGTSPYSIIWNDNNRSFDRTGLCAGNYYFTVTDKNGCSTTGSVTIDQPTPVVATVTQTNVNCSSTCSGTASVSVSGGTSPYTIVWNNESTSFNRTGLCGGNYSFTVTDSHGCTTSGSVNIKQSEPVEATVTKSDVTCHASCGGTCNGSASVNVTGGTSPYNIIWNGNYRGFDLNDLCGGTYFFTVTDKNGCSTTGSVTINTPTPVVATVTKTDVSCHPSCGGTCNGSADVNVTGGTSPYYIVWNDNNRSFDRTGLCSGNYYFTVTDKNGCSTTGSVTIDQPTPLVATISKTNINCTNVCNGTATITVSGGTPSYSIVWNDRNTSFDRTGLCGGNYTFTVTDSHGCTTTGSVNISLSDTLMVKASGENATCSGQCNGSITLSVSGGTAPYTYTWDKGDGYPTNTLTGLCAGTYCYSVTDQNGCSKTGCMKITQPDSIHVAVNHTNLTCNELNGLCDGTISLTVSGGAAPYKVEWSSNLYGSTSFDQTSLCPDTYCYTVTDAHGCSEASCVTITEPAPLLIASNCCPDDITCYNACNGKINISIYGGVAPFTYSWSGPNGYTSRDSNINNLCAGVYTVTVTDHNGCSYDNTHAPLINPTPIVANLTSVNVANCDNGICNGSATVSPSGGTAPYTIAWSNGQSGASISSLCIGKFKVTITDNVGCSIVDSVKITCTSLICSDIQAQITGPTNVCSGGTAVLSASPATNAIKYTWTGPDGFTASTPTIQVGVSGTYYVDILYSPSYCNAKDSITVAFHTSPTVKVTQTDVSCAASCSGKCDGTISLAISGVNEYTVLWSGPNSFISYSTALTKLCAGTYCYTVSSNGCNVTGCVLISLPPAVTFTLNSTNVTCSGASNGTAAVVTTGEGYTYKWSNGATTSSVSGLSAQQYCVTVTNATGCSASNCVTITQPTPVCVTVTTTNVSCSGNCNGSASACASGGTAPYKYKWSNGATTSAICGLCPNSYCVTVTSSGGCSVSKCITVTQPAPVAVTVTQTNVTCNGSCNGSACVTPTGGTAPYAYHWSNGACTASISCLCAGSYTVTVTSCGGCSISKCITITQPAPMCTVVKTSAVTCNSSCNGTASVTVSGGIAPYTYKWSTGATTASISGLCAGCYSVTVSGNGGCSVTSSFTISQPAALCVSLTSTNEVGSNSCSGTASVVEVTGGLAPYTYKWSNGDKTACITGLCAGTYYVTVTSAGGCTIVKSVTIAPCKTGSNARVEQGDGSAGAATDSSNSNLLEVYPNPFDATASIELVSTDDMNATVDIFNISGQKVAEIYQGQLVAGQRYSFAFNAAQLPSGMYICRLLSDKGTKTVNIVKINQ